MEQKMSYIVKDFAQVLQSFLDLFWKKKLISTDMSSFQNLEKFLFLISISKNSF